MSGVTEIDSEITNEATGDSIAFPLLSSSEIGSVKGVASSVGEGSMAVTFVHAVLSL